MMAPISALIALALLPAALGVPHQQPFGDVGSLGNDIPPSAFEADADGRERYDGHEVWRIDWSGVGDTARNVLHDILETTGDVWKATPNIVDVHLSPLASKALPSFLPAGAHARKLVPDLQALVNLSYAHPLPADGGPSEESYRPPRAPLEDPPTDLPDGGWNVSSLATLYHNAFQPLDAVYRFGDDLVAEFPALHKVEIGKSAEGRDIIGYSAHIHTDGGSGKHNDRPEIVIISGQHAREWVGPASAMYFLHALLVDATDAPNGRTAKLLRTFAFTIVPTINPDGYVYSREHSRMWRKNRQDVGGLVCKGLDLNTNWGYEFRPSRLACSESYSGQRAFEAPETAAMANYIINGTADDPRTHKVRAFIDLHSYGQLFMFPFSFSCNVFPPDAENLMEAGLGVAKAIRVIGGPAYQTGQACQSTLRFAGDAADYTYGVGQVRWSYSAELRDTGTYGFMLPPFLIRPTGIDVTAGVGALAWFIYSTEIDL